MLSQSPGAPLLRVAQAALGLALLCPGTLYATEVGNPRSLGLGLVLGEPTGITGKLFVGPENAWDGGIAFLSPLGKCRVDNRWESCGTSTTIALHGDYLWQYTLLDEDIRLSWHFGAGARVWIFSADRSAANFALGARLPLGVDLAFRKPEFLEAFLEFTPALYLLPGLGFNLEPAIGVRYYF